MSDDYIQCRQCKRVIPDDTEDTHCDCGMAIDENCNPLCCDKCHKSLHLEDGCEWPQMQPLYCWACAHDRLKELNDGSVVANQTAGLTLDKLVDFCQQSSNLGQVYGIASAMRTCAEEAAALSGKSFGQGHTEFVLGRIAKEADSVCGDIMNEWDRIKSQLGAQKKAE